MKLDPLLGRAAKLARKREYDMALKILRDEEDRYNGAFKYYYLCGIICLHAGSFSDARHYLEKAQKIKMQDPNVFCALAALFLRGIGTRGTDTSRAVDYYLDVLEMEPKNKIANKALSAIRAIPAEEDIRDFFSADKLSKFFPPIPKPAVNNRTYAMWAFIAAAFLIFLTGVLINIRILPNPFKNKNARPTAEFILPSDIRSSPVETGGSYLYILTRAEAVSLYEKALSLFSAYRDEKAKINLNKILASNAAEGLKNRARILMHNTQTPGFDNFKRGDNPEYAEVINEPALFSGVHVIWKGMATNAEITDEYTRFDLLVGYDTRSKLEGIITVTFPHPVSVNTERPLEVLGRIEVSPSLTQISLTGLAIHQSGRLE